MIHSDIYLEAAKEHASLAQRLYDEERYGPVHYLAGLAVECMLRAYRVRFDPQFDSRHDLKDLTRLAKFYDFVPEDRHVRMSALMSEVVQRWVNEHRYRSASAIRRWLKKQQMNWRIKGDILKESARRISNAAVEIVSEGALRWQRS